MSRATTAVILSGGRGSRLQPLTTVMPKPLLPFLGQPMISYVVRALVKVGVDHIILAVAYRADDMVKPMADLAAELGVLITFSREDTPLGTAGPLILLKEKLRLNNAPFYVLNADIIADYPFVELLGSHQQTGATATIVTTPVDDPSRYGVVQVDNNTGQVSGFIEKPQKFVGNGINAGIYLFNPSVLDYLPREPQPVSIEYELFPRLCSNNQLYAYQMEGRWMDVGTWADYLRASKIWNLDVGSDTFVDDQATVDPSAIVSHAVLFGGSQVQRGARVEYAILGWDVVVDPDSQVVGTAENPKVLCGNSTTRLNE